MTYARNIKILECKERGMSDYQISKHFGVTEKRIKHIIRTFKR